MTCSLLLILRKLPARILTLFSTREMLFWLMGLWIIYYTSAMIWDREAFAHFISRLKLNLVMQLPFLLFLFSGYLNLVRAFRSAWRESAVKILLSGALPLGLLLVFTGVFISITTRQLEWIMAMPGDSIQPRWVDFGYKVEEIDPGIKERILDTDSDEGSGLFKYEPKITVKDKRSVVHKIGAFPPSKIGDSFFHVLNFGLAPFLSISEQGVVKGQEYVPLKILAPGSSDSFEIQPLPYKFLISLEPDKVYQKGTVKAAEYNTRDPLYRIRVMEGQELIAEDITREQLHFKNMTLGLQKPVFWVQLEAVKDRGVYFILVGLFLLSAGIPLYCVQLLLRIFRK